MFQNLLRVVFAVSLVCFCSGCALVGALIDSYSRAGFTRADREAHLAEAVKDFNDALYWSNHTAAMGYVMEEARTGVLQELKNKSRDERVVESKIEQVDFRDDSYTADVEVTIRSYRVPFYVVSDRTQRQIWRFSTVSGWKLSSLESVQKK